MESISENYELTVAQKILIELKRRCGLMFLLRFTHLKDSDIKNVLKGKHSSLVLLRLQATKAYLDQEEEKYEKLDWAIRELDDQQIYGPTISGRLWEIRHE